MAKITLKTEPAKHTVKIESQKEQANYGGTFKTNITFHRWDDNSTVRVNCVGRPEVTTDELDHALTLLKEARA